MTRAAAGLCHEYFHGDNGAGIGASHQTGWTGMVATLIEISRSLEAAPLLEAGKEAIYKKVKAAPKSSKRPSSLADREGELRK